VTGAILFILKLRLNLFFKTNITARAMKVVSCSKQTTRANVWVRTHAWQASIG